MQMKFPRQNGKAKAKKAVQLLMARAAVSSSRLMAVVYLPRTNNYFHLSIYLSIIMFTLIPLGMV
jgi:hypothetical protein